MKRRGFLGALAAVIAAPKALMALASKPSNEWFVWGTRTFPDAALHYDASSPLNEFDDFGNVTMLRDLSGNGFHALSSEAYLSEGAEAVWFDHTLTQSEIDAAVLRLRSHR